MKSLVMWVWGLLSGIICFLLEGEVRALATHISEKLVRRASLKIPQEQRERVLGEYLADLDHLAQQGRYVSQLGHALQFQRNAWAVAHAVAIKLPILAQSQLAAQYLKWCLYNLKILLSYTGVMIGLGLFDVYIANVPNLSDIMVCTSIVAFFGSLQFYFEGQRIVKELQVTFEQIQLLVEDIEDLTSTARSLADEAIAHKVLRADATVKALM